MAGYSINITETQNIITATSSVNNIDITAYDQLFTITNTVQVFTATSVLQTTTIYTDAVELLVDDFANYFRGDWISGTTYRRGEIVNDRYSLFVCSTGTLTTVTSTINPSDYTNTLSWTRVVWNEAPRNHLTITNYLDVGTTASISGNTNIGGNLGVTGNVNVTGTTHLVGELTMDTPLDHLTVTNAVLIGGELRARDLIVDTTSTLNGTLTVAAATTLNGSLTANQASTFNGSLTANQAVTFNNTADLNGVNTLSTASFTKSVGIAHNLQVSGITTSGSLIVTNNALVGGNLTVTNTATILGSLNVGDITGNGGVSIAGSLRVNGTSTFNTATFNKPVTFNDVVDFNSTATFYEVDTDRLRVADVLYPLTQGLYGQVIANMGDNTAQWRNLGDLNFWSLNDDLRTNGFNIKSGSATTDLAIYRGSSINTATAFLKLGNTAVGSGGAQIFSISTVHLQGSGADILVGGTLRDPPNRGPNTPGYNILFKGANAGVEGSLWVETTATLNDVKIGGILRGDDGYGMNQRINVGPLGFRFSDGTLLTTALPDIGGALPIAGSNVLGGIKVGDNLVIDPVTGVLDAIPINPYELPTATASRLGGIRVGGGLTINQNGVLTVVFPPGGTGTITTSTITLGTDMFANGYAIRNFESDGTTGTFIDFAGDDLYLRSIGNARLEANTIDIVGFGSGDIILDHGNRFTSTNRITIAYENIKLEHPELIDLQAPQIQMGQQTTGHTKIGELRVNRIYNYAGTYAPFFPAGIQLADSTVQVTAYFPDGGPLPAV